MVKGLSDGETWVSDRATSEADHIPALASPISSQIFPTQRNPSPSRGREPLASPAPLKRSDLQTASGSSSTTTAPAYGPRGWWLFKAFGHEQVSVLDGGLTAWRVGGGPLERGPGAVEPTSFTANERPGFFVDTDESIIVER